MINGISRNQWKDIRDRIRKGGIQELKAFVSSLYESAFNEGVKTGEEKGYQKGIDMGVREAKSTILSTIDEALHQEFGIGPKRLTKFHSRFSQIASERAKVIHDTCNEENHQENIQQHILTGNDKDRYMILVCMLEFLTQMKQAQDTILFKDKSVQLDVICDQLNLLIHDVRRGIDPKVDDTIMKQLEDLSLYIAPTNLGKSDTVND